MTARRKILAVAIASAACPAWAAQSCENLASVPMPGIIITSAASVSAGSFKLPGAASAPPVQVPAFCRVAATVNRGVRMEL